ncbi:DUF6420 family protein [Streptomyces violaceusniger]|uniref:DUF6420 family protein n=1 Tax=Streptomyces violaceusniger TaxID=68280 RepID=UPI000996CEEF|nr:DUF6420 family protein [Streptomyces hygroscopicus]AQW50731.1 hypothetical protein SHXM_04194 [Streptomyces hygroscopicus]
MTSEHRGGAGPYIEYGNLPVLHATETDLPLLHPYGAVAVGGRYVTPGGGRLTVRKDGKHFQITLDHLGCPAQLTEEKTALFKRLGLAAKGHCLHAGCGHHVADAGAVLRSFHLRTGSIDLTAFVRAALAVELGDQHPVDRLLQDAEALVGPVRGADPQDE